MVSENLKSRQTKKVAGRVLKALPFDRFKFMLAYFLWSTVCYFLDSISKYWAFKSLTSRLSVRWDFRALKTVFSFPERGSLELHRASKVLLSKTLY